jgi:hypothetical protein
MEDNPPDFMYRERPKDFHQEPELLKRRKYSSESSDLTEDEGSGVHGAKRRTMIDLDETKQTNNSNAYDVDEPNPKSYEKKVMDDIIG